MKKIAVLVGTIVMMGGLTACGGQTQTVIEEAESAGRENVSNVSVNEEYFNWDGTIIESLTELGLKQEELIIPEKCTGFKGAVFWKSDVLTKVVFEDDDDIGLNGAFEGTASLEEVILPAQLSTIGDMEFNNCKNLKRINIPENVKVLSWSAFGNCESLENVEFSNSTIEEIGESAFVLCESLKEVKLPETVGKIGKDAFYRAGLESVTLPIAIKEIGAAAFSGNLKDVYVPEGVELENVDSSAFTQISEQPVAHVVEGSWADLNFEQWSGTITEKVYD